MEVDKTCDSLTLTQHKYTMDILSRSRMKDCKPLATLGIIHQKLSSKEGYLYGDCTRYRSIVGMLQYLTFTRPDIVYSVNQVSQFMHEPHTPHMEAVKRILRYLKGTFGDGLMYRKSELNQGGHEIIIYADTDWEGDPDERRSVSGYCSFIGSNIISWSSEKQKAVSRSSIEAEYRSMTAATAEATWIRHLLTEMGEPIARSLLLCDNQSAINMSFNPIYHNRAKHIEINILSGKRLKKRRLSLCLCELKSKLQIFSPKG